MTEFVVKQGEASFEARFASPAFVLLSQSNVELHPNMLLHLGKYGLTLNDIRIETGIPNLAGANVIYGMNALNVAVRVWLDRLEIVFGDLTLSLLKIPSCSLAVVCSRWAKPASGFHTPLSGCKWTDCRRSSAAASPSGLHR